MSSVQINNGSTVIGELANDSGTLVLRPKNSAPVRIEDASGNTLFDSTAPVANSKRVIAEYIFDADQELDYSSSFSDGMASATITFSELPTNTVEILAEIGLSDSGIVPYFQWKRSSADTRTFGFTARFADSGTNIHRSLVWMPTSGNTIYVTNVVGDVNIEFHLIGYKVAAS